MSDKVIIEPNQDYFTVMFYGDEFNKTEVRYFEFKHIVVDNNRFTDDNRILLTINDTVVFTIELTSKKEAIKVKKQIYNGKKRWKKTLPDAYIIDRREISIYSNNHPTKTIQLTDVINVCNSEDIVKIHYVYDSEEYLIYIKEECEMEAKILIDDIKRKTQDSILPDEFKIHPNHIWVLKAFTDIEHKIKFSEIVDVQISNTDTEITCLNRNKSMYSIRHKTVESAQRLVNDIKKRFQDNIIPDEFELHIDCVWVLKNKTDIDYDIKYNCITNVVLLNNEVAITWIHNNLTEFTSIIHKTRKSAQRTVDLLIHAMKIDQANKKKNLTEYTIYEDLIDVDGIEIPWKDINATDYRSNIISITHGVINVTDIIMSNETQAKVLAKDLQDRARDWWKSTKSKPKRYVVSIRTMYNKYEMVGYYSHNESSIVYDVTNKKSILLNIQEVDEFPVRIDVTIDLVPDLTVPDSSEYGF